MCLFFEQHKEKTNLTDEQAKELERQAKENGVTAEDFIKDLIIKFLARTVEIARFAAKKGPRK